MNPLCGTFVFSFLIVIACIVFVPVYKLLTLNLYLTSDVAYCPHCVGSDMCNFFISNSIYLNWNFFWRNLINYRGNKQILFGTFKNEIIVVKMIVDSSEYAGDNISHSQNISTLGELTSKLLINYPPKGEPLDHFTICPSFNRLDRLILPVIQRSKSKNLTELYWNILYMLNVHLEPIIQQALKGWAIAEYIGSCGKFSISKYCGSTLTSIFPKLDWSKRSLISQQLLQFALNATLEHPHFSFYFTDFSPDNIAISPEGEARLIDLEDVIIVDKFPTVAPVDWNIQHMNYHDETVNEFTFSTKELCSHKVSDLNIYAVCQGILSEKSDLLIGGFLHSPPRHEKNLKGLINQCVSPSSNQNRFSTAINIINLLKNI